MPVSPIWDPQTKTQSLSLHLLLLLTKTSKGRQGALHRTVWGAGSREEKMQPFVAALAPWQAAAQEGRGKGSIVTWIARGHVRVSSQAFSATCSSSSLKPDGMEEAQLPCWFCLLAKGQLALSFCPSRHIRSSPNLMEQGVRRKSMGKKADRASVTTWFTLVMLNLPAVCILSLPWDL